MSAISRKVFHTVCAGGDSDLARRRSLRLHLFEEGYLRPDWITLEREGVNANSRLPDRAIEEDTGAE